LLRRRLDREDQPEALSPGSQVTLGDQARELQQGLVQLCAGGFVQQRGNVAQASSGRNALPLRRLRRQGYDDALKPARAKRNQDSTPNFEPIL
jgi:hypothetical protein